MVTPCQQFILVQESPSHHCKRGTFKTPNTNVKRLPTNMKRVAGFFWITGTAISPQLSPATTVLNNRRLASSLSEAGFLGATLTQRPSELSTSITEDVAVWHHGQLSKNPVLSVSGKQVFSAMSWNHLVKQTSCLEPNTSWNIFNLHGISSWSLIICSCGSLLQRNSLKLLWDCFNLMIKQRCNVSFYEDKEQYRIEKWCHPKLESTIWYNFKILLFYRAIIWGQTTVFESPRFWFYKEPWFYSDNMWKYAATGCGMLRKKPSIKFNPKSLVKSQSWPPAMNEY